MTIGALYKKLRTDICDYGGKGVNACFHCKHISVLLYGIAVRRSDVLPTTSLSAIWPFL